MSKSTTGPDEAARCRQLLGEARAQFDALWDDDAAMVRNPDGTGHHGPRGTLAYANILLESDDAGDRERGDRAVRAVLALQERRLNDAHRGNFRWTLEEPVIRDLNGVEFMLDELIPIARERTNALPPATLAAIREAVALGLAEIDRLDVHLSYTNIALSDIANSVLGGELIGDTRCVERGGRRLRAWLDFTEADGAPHEYNSPTYAAVDLLRLAALAAGTGDPAVASLARRAEASVWTHVAAHYHPGLAQLAGPHARSYYDGWTGTGGYLKLLLWRVLGDERLRPDSAYAYHTREEGHAGIARAELHPPDEAIRWLREKRWPFEVQETVDRARGVDITTYMTASYALGTATRTYTVGEPPEPSRQSNGFLLQFRRAEPPGFGSMFARYVIDGREPAGASGGDGHGADWWDDGTIVAAQSRNRAIVAYGVIPRARPISSAKLTLRLFGAAGADVLAKGRAVADGNAARIDSRDAVLIAAGDAYVALLPLAPDDMASDATLVVRRHGEVLTLDIENYRGPPKVFWEYASLGGAFFKRNVRNAVLIEVAERSEYASLERFGAHVTAARLHDETDRSHVREITYACGCGEISMRYSLREMVLLARCIDGKEYVAPKSLARTLD